MERHLSSTGRGRSWPSPHPGLCWNWKLPPSPATDCSTGRRGQSYQRSSFLFRGSSSGLGIPVPTLNRSETADLCCSRLLDIRLEHIFWAFPSTPSKFNKLAGFGLRLRAAKEEDPKAATPEDDNPDSKVTPLRFTNSSDRRPLRKPSRGRLPMPRKGWTSFSMPWSGTRSGFLSRPCSLPVSSHSSGKLTRKPRCS